jgi:hypothetical protein
MQRYDGLERRVRWACAGAAAALLASSAFAASAGAAEPLNDHSGGAEPFGQLRGAIDRPGDRDWYVVTMRHDDSDVTVYASRETGSCAPDALRITVLNPEGRPIRWAVVRPGRSSALTMPSFKPGDYFVEIDAAGEPGCAALTYSGGTYSMGSNPDTRAAKCKAARSDYSERVKARNNDRKYAKQGNARSQGYLKKWPKTLKRYLALAKAACRKK